MRRILLFAAIMVFFCAGVVDAGEFTLRAPGLQGQLTIAQVFNGFGCAGENISPLLKWSNAPKGAKSFAVTVYDMDAPTGSGWWHWVIFNIPANVNELKEDAGNIGKNLAPRGSVQGMTDFGRPGFGGACPPAGDKAHRYIFTVYALNVAELGLDAKTPPAMVGFFLHQDAIAKASVISYYKR
ncbi:MAG: YbhB/YbcL family Raf kinase inhibitor-like protein [Nitrospiraceae bacterium]|nr:YbhB/YbcL family Raf kinase inhibitor-like protein [Nitrospiraceae bacterium]